jgi:hypothetical protein
MAFLGAATLACRTSTFREFPKRRNETLCAFTTGNDQGGATKSAIETLSALASFSIVSSVGRCFAASMREILLHIIPTALASVSCVTSFASRTFEFALPSHHSRRVSKADELYKCSLLFSDTDCNGSEY